MKAGRAKQPIRDTRNDHAQKHSNSDSNAPTVTVSVLGGIGGVARGGGEIEGLQIERLRGLYDSVPVYLAAVAV